VAHNLGWKIAHVLRGAPAGLLDTYEQERLPIAADVLNLSSKLIAGRIKGVAPGDRRGSDTLQLKMHYPVSELNGSRRGGQTMVQAGDRAPDSLLQGPDGTAVRLFDLFRGPHTSALAFGPRSSKVADALAEHFHDHLKSFTVLRAASPTSEPSMTHFTDNEGHTHLDYGMNGDALLIIRPDGYVGMRATDPDEAEIFEYLSQLLPTASGAGVWSFDGEK
jgi:hypothetical protein